MRARRLSLSLSPRRAHHELPHTSTRMYLPHKLAIDTSMVALVVILAL